MLRLTEEQLTRHRARVGKPAPAPAPAPAKRFKSKLEESFAQLLGIRLHDGRIVRWGYERIKLRLPGGVWYTPDFDVAERDGQILIYECKGFMRESARNKVRAAIELYPDFGWWMVTQELREIPMVVPDDVPAIRKGVR